MGNVTRPHSAFGGYLIWTTDYVPSVPWFPWTTDYVPSVPWFPQQRQVQVGHGGVRIDDLTAGGKLTVPAAQYDRRQIAVAVDVPVAQTAAVDDHGVIEQRSIAILNRLEPVDEVGELLHVMDVDLGDLLHQVRKWVDHGVEFSSIPPCWQRR